MALNTINGDVLVNGVLYAKQMAVPAGTITDAGVSAAAGIQSTKLQQQRGETYTQMAANATVIAERRVVHVVYGATGLLLRFSAGSVVAHIGAAVCTVDLKKNGVSVLSAPITLNSSNVALTPVNATITTTGLVAGDVLEVVTTATAGGGTLATGVFAQVDFQEDPA